MSLLDHSYWQALFDRQDKVMRIQPKCPACRSPQVQIMSWAKPAQWKCRVCRFRFVEETDEPE
jgi:transposase-like protein